MAEPYTPDESFDRQPAEGSRDTINSDDRAAAERYRDDNAPSDEGGGISNHPIADELKRQRDLPARGNAKRDGHAS